MKVKLPYILNIKTSLPGKGIEIEQYFLPILFIYNIKIVRLISIFGKIEFEKN